MTANRTFRNIPHSGIESKWIIPPYDGSDKLTIGSVVHISAVVGRDYSDRFGIVVSISSLDIVRCIIARPLAFDKGRSLIIAMLAITPTPSGLSSFLLYQNICAQNTSP